MLCPITSLLYPSPLTLADVVHPPAPPYIPFTPDSRPDIDVGVSRLGYLCSDNPARIYSVALLGGFKTTSGPLATVRFYLTILFSISFTRIPNLSLSSSHPRAILPARLNVQFMRNVRSCLLSDRGPDLISGSLIPSALPVSLAVGTHTNYHCTLSLTA